MTEKPELIFRDEYEVPDCELPAAHPYRKQNVIVTRVDNGYDIRISLPMLLQMSDESLGGPLSHRAEEIAKNVGVMMTNDLWLEIVPLIKEMLECAVEPVGTADSEAP